MIIRVRVSFDSRVEVTLSCWRVTWKAAELRLSVFFFISGSDEGGRGSQGEYSRCLQGEH